MHAIRQHEFGPPEPPGPRGAARPDARPPARCGSRSRRAGCTCSDTTIRRGEPGPLPPPDAADRSRAARSRATVDAASATGSTGPGSGDGSSRTSGRCRAGTPSRPSPRSTCSSRCPTTSGSPTRSPRSAPAGPRSGSSSSSRRRPTTSCWSRRPPAAWAGSWSRTRGRAARRVIAAAGGPERTARLAELAPDQVVDYGEDGWEEQVDGVTLVYDGVGGEVGRTALELLRPGGRLVMFGFSAGAPTRLDTGDLVGRSITAGWSLGPRMMALPGGIPGLAARALDRVAAGELAAARHDVPARRRGPGARRPRGPAGAGQGRADVAAADRRRDEFGGRCRSHQGDWLARRTR